MSYPAIIASFVLAQNLVFTRLLGLCPLVAVSRSRECAVAVGSGVLFVGALSSLCTWAAHRLVLLPLGLGWLQIAAFMLIMAAVTRLMEGLVRALSPALHALLGPHVEHTMTNSVVLGVCLIVSGSDYGIMQGFVAGLSAAGGFLLAAWVASSLSERLDLEWVPGPFKGAPIALISAGLLALAFVAFDGVIKARLPG